jgi:phosphate transport system substrate-binding protein
MKLKALMAIGLIASAAQVSAREHIEIVGSSTVYPFTTVVAERFGKATQFRTPTVESTGTGGGMQLFCGGVGVGTPDMTNASRRIKSSEVELCASNGVNEIVEVKVGYDGIVMANSVSAQQFDLTPREIFLALGKLVPNPDGSETLIENPYRTWNEVNSSLPAVRIEVLGPPPSSGTRDAFAELALESGCKSFDWIAAMKSDDKNRFKAVCHGIREDGAYVEAGENDNLIVQKLAANPNSLGVFGYSFLESNADVVHGAMINGIAPEFEAISDGSYPISRALYFYVKAAHVNVVPGIEEFLAEFTSEASWGDDGYLTDRGLIPMPEEERTQVGAAVRSLEAI